MEGTTPARAVPKEIFDLFRKMTEHELKTAYTTTDQSLNHVLQEWAISHWKELIGRCSSRP